VSELKFLEFDKEIVLWEEYSPKNRILFFLKGNFSIDCSRYVGRKFVADEMVLIAKSSPIRIQMEAYAQMLVMSFDTLNSAEGYSELQALKPLCRDISYDFEPIPLREPLRSLMRTFVDSVRSGTDDQPLYDVVLRNFLVLLRVYYTKEEVVRLVYPIMGKEMEFKDFILQNYLHVSNLNELIEQSTLCRTTFFAKFKEEFGTTAKQWMTQQLRDRILWKIREPGVRVKELISECNFESRAQFYRYFRQQFQCTPRQLIRRYQDMQEQKEKELTLQMERERQERQEREARAKAEAEERERAQAKLQRRKKGGKETS
jgi:AraC-like DNA-binding protein